MNEQIEGRLTCFIFLFYFGFNYFHYSFFWGETCLKERRGLNDAFSPLTTFLSQAVLTQKQTLTRRT